MIREEDKRSGAANVEQHPTPARLSIKLKSG